MKENLLLRYWRVNKLEGDFTSPRLAASPAKQLYTSLLLTGVLSLPFSAHADNQLNTVLQDIARQEQSVQQQKKQRAVLENQLAQQDKIIAESSKTLRQTQITLNQLNKEIATLNGSINELQQQQAVQQTYLKKQLEAAFRLGKHSGLQLMLAGEESHRSERMLAYFSYINEIRQNNIDDLKQTQIELGLQQNQLEQKQQQQKTLLSHQQSEQRTLEQARTGRTTTLKALDASLQKDQEKLQELKRNEAQLRNKIAQAEREARVRADREAKEAEKLLHKQNQAKQQGTKYTLTDKERELMARTGGLGTPQAKLNWPVKGKILHRFGERQQGELQWKAMIIASPEGSEVKAVADGIVVMASWLAGYGYMIAVDHGKNDMSLYGYNQSVLVNLHEPVKAGQAIGLVGINSEQKQPALYFEIRRKGQTVDPQNWLKKP